MLSKCEAPKLLENVSDKYVILRFFFLFFLYETQFTLEVGSHYILFLLSVSLTF